MLVAGCGGSDAPEDGPADGATSSSTSGATSTPEGSTGTGEQLGGELTVFAAASLQTTFTELGAQFEAANPGATVTFSFAGSSDLAAQIIEGAPAEVFASADENNMTKVTDEDLTATDPVAFATNTLAIATPADNPAGVTSFADLADPELTVVVCAPQVPCGAATQRVEEATGVDISPASEEPSVTDVLGKVTSGEADAGLVYVTDITAAGDRINGIDFPESDQAINTYPIAPLAESDDADLATAFVDYVTSPDGQAVLTDAGFGSP